MAFPPKTVKPAISVGDIRQCALLGSASSGPGSDAFADQTTFISESLAGKVPNWIYACLLLVDCDEIVVHLSPRTSVLDQRFKSLQGLIRENLQVGIAVRFAIHKPEENLTKKLARITGKLVLNIAPGVVVIPNTQRFEFANTPATAPLNASSVTQQTQSLPSNEELFSEATRTLPLEIELLRPLRYVLPLDGGVFDFLVLRLAVPQHKEGALRRWRKEFESRHKVRVLVERSRAFSGTKEQLMGWVNEGDLLTQEHLPRLERYLKGVFGQAPSVPRNLPLHEDLVDLTKVPFIAIDSLDTRAREDLVHAEPSYLPQHVHLRVAYIDVTPFVTPGNYHDRYAKRIGASVFASHSQIHTLGPDIANGLASFLNDSYRAAWVVSLHISPLGEISHYEVLHAKVMAHAHVAPEQVNRMLLEPSACPLVLHYLQQAASSLHSKRMNQKRIMLLEGDGLGGIIVGQSMLAGKSALARFLVEKQIPAIFKVHTPPTQQRKEEFAMQVRACGVEAKESDFDEPLSFAAILQSLEEKHATVRAQSTLQEILDVFLTRSRFDTINRGHFGIGVDAYLEIKPRDATGIANQYQLLHLFHPKTHTGLSLTELEYRAARRNRQAKERGTVEYRLRFLERIAENLKMVGSSFIGSVKEVLRDRLLIEVPGFTKWGVVPFYPGSKYNRYSIGEEFEVSLKGFSVERMRFVFAGKGRP